MFYWASAQPVRSTHSLSESSLCVVALSLLFELSSYWLQIANRRCEQTPGLFPLFVINKN